MTQEDKQLLLKDLCGRLPYGVKINYIIYNWEGTAITFNGKLESFAMEKDNGLCYDVPVEEVRPYLRPMSSMTEGEKEEYRNECNKVLSMPFKVNGPYPIVDWLNAHHFDHRGLIPMGLAIEAPEGMYKTE